MQGTAERRAENSTGECVKNKSSILTESYSDATKPAAQKLGQFHTGTTASQVSPVHTLSDAAECDENNSIGPSFPAGKEVAPLGNSSKTTSRRRMTSGQTQQQPAKTSETQQQKEQPATHQQRNDQHHQQQLRPPERTMIQLLPSSNNSSRSGNIPSVRNSRTNTSQSCIQINNTTTNHR